jgi:hypothetical protein
MNDNSGGGNMQIMDLPDLILANIVVYLSKPSVPLFAIAVTPQASDGSSDTSDITWQPTSTSNAIIVGAYGERHTLDFEEIEGSLASRVTDDHVRDILICIDAINNLKVLKLTDCINIQGHGLDILRGSLVLECIESHKPQLNNDNLPQLRLSPNVIISLLESIVESPGNKLQHIYLPDIVYNEDSAELVVNSNVLHFCVERGPRCGAMVKYHPSSQTWGGRPECKYCQCKVIELVMIQCSCSKTRAHKALELNDWDVVNAILHLTP